MAGEKEIKRKIRSVEKTKKITCAMEMVAASKMRKAQDRMMQTRPYAEKICQVITHLSHAHPEYRHAYMASREVKRVGYIVVSTDRGLCGGLNNLLFKQVAMALQAWQQKGVEAQVCTIGTKADGFFKRLGLPVVAKAIHLGDAPRARDLVGVVQVMLQHFDQGMLDAVFLAHNRFINTMSQEATLSQLLPISDLGEQRDGLESAHWDYIYEPDAKELIDLLLKRYIESQVYQSVVENLACEQAARRVAMKNATDNAGEMIDSLQLVYNKARQAAITQELAEIVAGAAAV